MDKGERGVPRPHTGHRTEVRVIIRVRIRFDVRLVSLFFFIFVFYTCRVDSGSVNALAKHIPVNFTSPLQQHNIIIIKIRI